ncbi:hypothetical protein ACOSQ4_017211 [Xanthoceras sorbifolium]
MRRKASDAKGKGKAVEASKRLRRNTPRFNRETITETQVEAVFRELMVRDPSLRLSPLPKIVKPLTIVHEIEKTSSSGSVRVKEYLAGDDRSHHFRDLREILNTYALGGSTPSAGGSSSEYAFTPEDVADFMCANMGKFIRSTKGAGLDKMSNDDCMRVAAFHTWMVCTFQFVISRASLIFELITSTSPEVLSTTSGVNFIAY